VNELGEWEALGFALGGSETKAFWLEFLRSLMQRGLKGVQWVISDAPEGSKAAMAQVLSGSGWQRCRVHFTLAPALQGQLCAIYLSTYRVVTRRWSQQPYGRSLYQFTAVN